MNYTHTLEMLYGINKDKVLHIHGEVGANNLILGYPEENYQPEKYYYDVRQKGRGPYREVDIQKRKKQFSRILKASRTIRHLEMQEGSGTSLTGWLQIKQLEYCRLKTHLSKSSQL